MPGASASGILTPIPDVSPSGIPYNLIARLCRFYKGDSRLKEPQKI